MKERMFMLRLDEQILLWNHTSVKVLDIRQMRLEAREEIAGYRLPANAFLCSFQGGAQVRLNGTAYRMERSHVLHGVCGATLHIAADEPFHYWLVLYKAYLMLPPAKRWFSLFSNDRPFHEIFSFAPLNPLALQNRLELMHRDWSSRDPLLTLRARSLFFPFVYELLSQMKCAGMESLRPDPLTQALRYMEERYMQPITLEEMAAMLGCSVSYVTKLFKKKLQTSPMRHLAELRLEAAAKLLLQSDAPLQLIAEQVGYPDAHALSRSFKKHYRYSPSAFRSRADAAPKTIPKMPARRTGFALLPPSSQCYSVDGGENHSHLKKYGGVSLYKTKKSASFTAATLMIGLSLLLSACSGNTAPSPSPAASESAPAIQVTTTPAAQESTAPAGATKVYTSSFGSVTIPANPERIVDLTGSAIGNLLQLGVKPIAAVDFGLENPFHEGMIEGIQNIGDGNDPEAILTLEPDLIIVFSYVGEEAYETLSQIAPTVRLEYGAQKPAELLLEFGKITGKEDEAQSWVDNWKQKIEAVKPDIVAAVGDKTVSILQPHAKGIYGWGNKGGRGGEILYDEFGLKAPPLVKEQLIDGELAGQDFSLEQLPQYAGDFIFTSEFGWDNDTSGLASAFYDSALWKNLDAVKNGNVYRIDPMGFYYNDPISLEKQLDFIVESLLGK